MRIGVRRTQTSPPSPSDGVAQRLDPEALEMNPTRRNPAIAGSCRRRRRRHDHHEIAGYGRAEAVRPQEPLDSRHGRIEQDQVDIGVLFQRRGESSNQPASYDLAHGTTLATAPQRIPEQRIVIGNNGDCSERTGSFTSCARLNSP